GVVITDVVPVSVTVQNVISSGMTITDTGIRPGYVWQVQDLPPGAGGVITITGVLNSTGLPTGVFTNSGTIGSATVDSDPTNNSGTAGVMVLNVAPVAVNDNYTTGDDVPLTVAAPGVLGNDSDANGDSLTAVLSSGPSSGTLALSGDGSFTYTPTLGFDSVDTFTYYAGDGTVNSNGATVVITVTSVNTPPTISDIPDQTTNVGNSVGPVSFTIEDLETPASALTLLAGSSDSTLVPVGSIVFGGSGTNRTVAITPTAGLTGTTTITITVDDGADTAGDTFVLTVEPFRIYLPLVLRNG
ncbi:MAG: cadherin-like domain-containing protein, partial [Anaerolineae bacterium]|nr:cadherin-like domain-containing protein [Anaerolineae bacterium]